MADTYQDKDRETGLEKTAIDKGWFVHGISAQRGVVMTRPGLVAFFPTERPMNLAAELAWGLAGFVEVGARKIHPEKIMDMLRAASDPEETAVSLAGSLAGLVWRPDSVLVKEKKILLRPGHRGLWFLKGRESIRWGRALPLREFARIRLFLADWRWE